MSEFCGNGDGLVLNGNITCAIARYIGQTVTIFTTSGGMSGSGFTGVVLGVNDSYVKLLSQIGPAPGCALGNSCGGDNYPNQVNMCNSVYNVGSVTEIPICSIASFVHSAL
jgi:hypothetical protein